MTKMLDSEPQVDLVQENKKPGKRFSPAIGITATIVILVVFAGATFFFLSRPTEENKFIQEGQKQLSLGQYAFAVKSLEQAASVNRNNPKIFLLLARAYVGIDQIDKAMDCIAQAQQLGGSVVQEPVLASELANYYRQHNQYERAIQLILPLVQAGMQDKKAELADLNALWGDECLDRGNLDQAAKCWEQVKEMQAGTRLAEADARLSTIYQRLANACLVAGDDQQALEILLKLNTIVENATTLVKTADIYERKGDYEQAITLYKKALKSGEKVFQLDNKIARAMLKRGQDLLDKGDLNGGFGLIQQAKVFDNVINIPKIVLTNVSYSYNGQDKTVSFSAQGWNPGPNPVLSLSYTLELVDPVNQKIYAHKSERVIDEFMPPLAANESRDLHQTLALNQPAKGNLELRVFIDKGLYKTYKLDTGSTGSSDISEQTSPQNDESAETNPNPTPINDLPTPSPKVLPSNPMLPLGNASPKPIKPAPAAINSNQPSSQPMTYPDESPADRTLKDLD